ncbi:MAG TPA: DUF1820 family protein [Rhodanobacteraceae bacterium]|nr:DUF1820 family protein [Rhodanobacteraceae bacterium]
MTSNHLYRVSFVSQGQVYEIYARSISHGELLGFVEVEQLVFGERTQMVVDPSEERLKTEFEGVERTYIPVHAILRIDQVDHRGRARIQAVSGDGAKVTPFPVFTPGSGPRK